MEEQHFQRAVDSMGVVRADQSLEQLPTAPTTCAYVAPAQTFIDPQATGPYQGDPTTDAARQHHQSSGADGLRDPAQSLAKLPPIEGYEILAVLGRGGMGVVYKARQAALNRLVALKMVLAGSHAAPEQIARFRSEAGAVARLQHPHIVQIFEVGEVQGFPFFSLELVDGGNLAQRFSGKQQAPRRAAELVYMLAGAVEYAHVHGVIHRDLKPANVLLTREGSPKIADFGLAKHLDDESGQTQSGSVLGTPSYMAPEQALGRNKDVGPAADVYALGAILYEALTGRPPFRGETPLDTLTQVRTQEPAPVRQFAPKAPRDLETICLTCLQKELQKRYGSAQALAEDLGRFLAGEPIRARPVGQVERLWLWCRRYPVGAGLILTLFLGTAVAASLAVWALGERDRADREAATALENEKRAQQERDFSSRRYYAAEMKLASMEWEDGWTSLVLQRLAAQQPKRVGDPDWRGFEWYYLMGLCRLDIKTIPTRLTSGLLGGSPAYSRDGQRLASPAADSTVKVFHTATGEEVLTLRGHKGPVWAVAYSPDGQRLGSTSEDRTVKVWDAATGRELLTLVGHKGAVWGVAYSPDSRRLASASSDRTVKVWDAATGQVLLTLRGHTASVLGGVAYSPDGRRLASASEDQTVKVWDAATGQALLTLRGHMNLVRCVAFSPDGGQLASGGRDKTVKVWDAVTGRELLTFRGHKGDVSGVVFSRDGRRLASSSYDQTSKVWDVATGQEIVTLRGHQNYVSGIAYSPDGWRLATTSGDYSVKVWDAAGTPEAFVFRRHTDQVSSVAFSPDGRWVGSGSGDGTLKVWETITGQEVLSLRGHTPGDLAVAFSPDGLVLASGGGDKTVKVWDATTGQNLLTLRGHSAGLKSVVFSPDGRRLASASADATVKVWDLDGGKELLSFRGHTEILWGLAYSPDGRRLASSSQDGTVKVWDAASGRELFSLRGHTRRVTGVAYSSDSQRLASCSSDRHVKVWDAASGEELLTLRGHTGAVWAVTFSPDGQRLATASADQTVRLWDSVTGQELLPLQGHASVVQGVAFSRDGRRLASASQDHTVRVWDAAALSLQLLIQREAQGLVRFLSTRPLSKEEVLAAIRQDQTISEAVRQQALAWVQDEGFWPDVSDKHKK